MPDAFAGAEGLEDGLSAFDTSILVLDEDLAVLGAMAHALGDLGYRRVKTAHFLDQGVDLVARHRAEVVLLGFQGEAGTSRALLAALAPQIQSEALAVMLLAPAGDTPALRQALSTGVVDRLSPIDGLHELGMRLRNVLVSRWRRTRMLSHDGLTGLPNRLGMRRRLEAVIAQSVPEGTSCAVIHVDLDRFRNVNESLGHTAGDAVLCEAASRIRRSLLTLDDTTVALRKALWSGVSVARVTGNGFVVLIKALQTEFAVQHAAELAQRLHDVFTEPMEVGGRKLYQTVSTGIAFFPADGRDADVLLAAAEQAMYQAKSNGRNGYEFCSAPASKPLVHRMVFETDIRRVLDRDELRVHYQPRVEIATGRILGVEALVRWEHPEHGLISPALFIPLAEELGLIADIGRWVMEQACLQSHAWAALRLGALEVSVNVSSPQLRNQRLWRDVREVLRASGLPPRRLVLELTESMIMDDAEDSVRMLHDFKDLGVQCAIDDFGTGYSSLAYLTRFPLNEIKIDRSFVKPLAGDRQSQAIASTIIALARELGAHTVAEGVETAEQLQVLRDLGCDQFQGYFCSEPLPPERMTDFLRACKTPSGVRHPREEKPARAGKRRSVAAR